MKTSVEAAGSTGGDGTDGMAAFTPALTEIDGASYDAQLEAKAARVREQFAQFNPPQLEVYTSRPQHYRMR